jgi:molecular chaperone DnaK (HSP70)
MPGMSLVEAIPLSIGTLVDEGVFGPIIPRNTSIPTQITECYSTALNNQTTMGIDVRLESFIIRPPFFNPLPIY